MGFDGWPILRRAALPFAAGVGAALALQRGLYASFVVSVLIALWAAALIQQAVARRAAPPPPPPAPPADSAARRRLDLYLDLSPAPLVSLDAAGRLRAINRAARRLFGGDDLVAHPPPALAAAILATAPGRPGSVRIDPGGGTRAFALLAADLDGGGETVRVAALVDIEADLKAVEAATLRDLVQVLGHEITNTLTPIASLSATAAEMLADPDADIAAVRGAIETVARRAHGLQRFGEAYRDLSRLPPPTLAPVDLERVIGDLATLFATRWPGVTLRVGDTPAPRVAADADQLAQALWAILNNAAEVATTVSLDVVATGPTLVIRIADNGPGVAAADAAAIFRPFFTTKAKGSGVGLALARQVFRSHGGDLSLVDAPGGATFEVVLPLGG